MGSRSCHLPMPIPSPTLEDHDPFLSSFSPHPPPSLPQVHHFQAHWAPPSPCQDQVPHLLELTVYGRGPVLNKRAHHPILCHLPFPALPRWMWDTFAVDTQGRQGGQPRLHGQATWNQKVKGKQGNLGQRGKHPLKQSRWPREGHVTRRHKGREE